MSHARASGVLFAGVIVGMVGCETASPPEPTVAPTTDVGAAPAQADPAMATAQRMITEGRRVFRFDTFGDEAFWTDALKLHHAIQGKAHNGVGDGLSPKAALGVGLKVDADALPKTMV